MRIKTKASTWNELVFVLIFVKSIFTFLLWVCDVTHFNNTDAFDENLTLCFNPILKSSFQYKINFLLHKNHRLSESCLFRMWKPLKKLYSNWNRTERKSGKSDWIYLLLHFWRAQQISVQFAHSLFTTRAAQLLNRSVNEIEMRNSWQNVSGEWDENVHRLSKSRVAILKSIPWLSICFVSFFYIYFF